ncbi:MAG TPA: FAD-dependent oxidoreductase [Ensifer sp.]|nr:FAD-dependent oxidoreductase [Ensifer sp.]
MSSVVIVGAGHGGTQAAASLREEGFDGAVVLIGNEPGIPYHRPPLSKSFMEHGDPERIFLRSATFFREKAIDYRPGLAVIEIDPGQRTVTTSDGKSISYGQLILATGSQPFRPPIPGSKLPGIVSLHRLDDAVSLRARLQPAARAVVIGAGFIGLEFAAKARQIGLHVTVIEAESRVLGRAVSAALAAEVEARHRALGVDLRLNAVLDCIHADASGNAHAVQLRTGETIEADILLFATGIRPNTALAEASGLAVSNGVVVDEFLSTSDENISALGDCANFPDHTGGERIRLECVQAATDHARTIARRLTGKPEPYRSLPWFWSDQGDMKLQIAGFDGRRELPPGDVFTMDLGNGRYVACRFAAGQLKAVETLNAPALHMAARKLLAFEAAPRQADVIAADGNLQSLLSGKLVEN